CSAPLRTSCSPPAPPNPRPPITGPPAVRCNSPAPPAPPLRSPAPRSSSGTSLAKRPAAALWLNRFVVDQDAAREIIVKLVDLEVVDGGVAADHFAAHRCHRGLQEG